LKIEKLKNLKFENWKYRIFILQIFTFNFHKLFDLKVGNAFTSLENNIQIKSLFNSIKSFFKPFNSISKIKKIPQNYKTSD